METRETVRNSLQFLSADCDHDTWTNICTAVKSAGGSFEDFDSWSQKAPKKYNAADCRRTWDSFKPSGNPEGAAGYLRKMAKEAGAYFSDESPTRPRPQAGPADGIRLQYSESVAPGVREVAASSHDVFKTMDPEAMAEYIARCEENRSGAEDFFCRGRGLSPAIVSMFHLGFDAARNAGVIPYLGEAMYCVRRYAAPRPDQSKYENPKGGKPVFNAVSLAQSGKPVFVLEGQIDALSVIDAGGFACTGLNEKKTFVDLAKDSKAPGFIIIADRDEDGTGEKKAQEVKSVLEKNGRPCEIVLMPDEIHDVNDFLRARGREALQTWVQETEKIFSESVKTLDRRKITSPQNGAKGGRKGVDNVELAHRFVVGSYSVSIDKATFCTLRNYKGRWLFFDGRRWREENIADLKAKITAFLQRVKEEQEEEARKSKKSDDRTINVSESAVKNVLRNLDSDAVCHLDSGKFSMPCFLPDGKSAEGWMPMRQCALNIEAAARALSDGRDVPTEAMIPHSPKFFTAFGMEYPFDAGAKCPKWEKYLSEVQPDAENRRCLQMMSGLFLVPDTRCNVAFFLYGPPGTGKTVFEETIRALVGDENTCAVPLARFSEKFGLAPLTEKLVNIMGDMPAMPESGRMSDIEGMFKDVTAGGTIHVENKGVDAWEAKVIARMLFATNVMPDFTDREGAVFDRLRIIPFDVRIRDTAKQNTNLINELREELPGIFVWALKGLAMLRDAGNIFPDCPKGREIKEELRKSWDHERTFLLEYTEEAKGSFCCSDTLYRRYREWAVNNGYRPVGAGKFKAAVRRLYPAMFEDRRHSAEGKIRVFSNIREVFF